MNFSSALLMVLAGGVGSLFRVLLIGLAETATPNFPWGTLLVNVLGSFCIGVLWVLAEERSSLSPVQFKLLAGGFLGGFTTFSAFSLDSLLLLQEGAFLKAAFYIFITPSFGIAATALGIFVTRA